jgi:hypothetical protein
MMDIRESILSKRNLDNHLKIVRERYESQGLSVLELREKQFENQAQLDKGGLSSEVVQRLEAEASLVKSMASELEGPEPTIEDEASYLREQGMYEAAEDLEYTNALLQAEEKVAEIQARLDANDYENNYLREQDQSGLGKAQEELAKFSIVPPSIAREEARESLRNDAEQLKQMAKEHVQSSDHGLRQRALDMEAEAAEKLAQLEAMPIGNDGARAAFFESQSSGGAV